MQATLLFCIIITTANANQLSGNLDSLISKYSFGHKSSAGLSKRQSLDECQTFADCPVYHYCANLELEG